MTITVELLVQVLVTLVSAGGLYVQITSAIVRLDTKLQALTDWVHTLESELSKLRDRRSGVKDGA
jgi:hypothetical protein